MGHEQYAGNQAYEYDNKMGEQGDLHHQMLLNPVMERLLPLQAEHVLDAGCGNGYWTKRLAQRFTHVTGLDSSTELIELARKKRAKDNIDYLVGELGGKLPLPNNRYDLVFANMVLHHVEDIDTVAKEYERIMTPGAIALMSITHPAYEIDKQPALATVTNRTLYTRKAFHQSTDATLYFEPVANLAQHFIDAGLTSVHTEDIIISQAYAEAEAESNREPKYLKRIGMPRAAVFVFQKESATTS